MRLALLGGLVVGGLAVAFAVYSGWSGFGVLLLHLTSVACALLVLAAWPIRPRLRSPRLPPWRTLAPVAVLVVLQLALARYFGTFPLHFQHDEFIAAYTSFQLPDVLQIQWYVGYPEKGSWVCQFPILFFVLQKPILMLLGPTVDAVRISAWPYLALTVVYLYMFARELSTRRAFAFVASLCAIVFAPSLYLLSTGGMIHSSMLFLVASLYHLIRLMRTERRGDALLCGLFSAFAYLTYTSSYITLPLLLAFVAFEASVRRSTKPVRLILPSLVVFAIVMLPFVVSAFTKDNYFLERASQVNTLSGDDYGQPALERGDAAIAFFVEQLSINVRALYEAGQVARETGYLFGDQAFFSPLGLALFALGNAVGLYRAVFRAERGYLLVSAILLAAFASGLVLTLPAGGFHRISLIYPFVGLSIAGGVFLPVTVFGRCKWRRVRDWPIGHLVALVIVAAFCVTSLSSAHQMIEPDQTHDSPYIAQYIEEVVPAGGPVAIAAPFNYHLARELFFRSGGRKYVLKPLSELLEDPQFCTIVLAYPSADQLQEARARFPKAQFISDVDEVPLRDHYIVILAGCPGNDGDASDVEGPVRRPRYE